MGVQPNLQSQCTSSKSWEAGLPSHQHFSDHVYSNFRMDEYSEIDRKLITLLQDLAVAVTAVKHPMQKGSKLG